MAAREESPPDAPGKAEAAAAAPGTGTAAAAPGTGTVPALPGGDSAMKSPLEKSLCELTEEDIAQVTREDCRRFLKEKGMRRPSWNKSQAIQQVISLKALLEDRHDGDDDAPSTTDPAIPAFFARRPPEPLVPITAPQAPIPPPLCSPPLLRRVDTAAAEPQIAPAWNAPSPCHRREPALPGFSGSDVCYRFPVAGGGALPPNTAGLPSRASAVDGEEPAGQLTIFYDGRVSVYDGVSPDKALVIMQIAASPSCYDLPPLPRPSPLPSRPLQSPELAQLPPPSGRPLQCHELAQTPPYPAGGGGGCFRPPLAPVPALAPPSAPPVAYSQISQSTGRVPQHFRGSTEDWRDPRDLEPEGPTSRAASLQRYFEKRKDRFKCKKHVVGSSSGMEMYLSQKIRNQIPNGQLSCNEMCSPTQAPRPPQTPTRCNSIENPVQNLRICIDLNDDAASQDVNQLKAVQYDCCKRQ
ncbi:hypothetical protein Taro_008712, partial [Colocasia esculenta]|nr:hypothetical protein [Colocasia esculenta]